MDIPLDFRSVRFASDDLPTQDRLPAWRDFYGPRVHGSDIQPAPGVPFRAKVTLRALPGFGLTTTESSPARYARSRRFLADGRDYFGLHLSFAGGACGQRGREIGCGPRVVVLMNVAEAGWIVSPRRMKHWACGFIAPSWTRAWQALTTGCCSRSHRIRRRCDAAEPTLGGIDVPDHAIGAESQTL
jgi:hypothetical protein